MAPDHYGIIFLTRRSFVEYVLPFSTRRPLSSGGINSASHLAATGQKRSRQPVVPVLLFFGRPPQTPLSHHADPPAVGTNPGRPVADSPEILLETRIANLEAARAVPAEWQNLPATVTLKILLAPPAGIKFFLVRIIHANRQNQPVQVSSLKN